MTQLKDNYASRFDRCRIPCGRISRSFLRRSGFHQQPQSGQLVDQVLLNEETEDIDIPESEVNDVLTTV
jgi:hypothetical protein